VPGERRQELVALSEPPAEPVPGGESNLWLGGGFGGGDAVLNASFLAPVELWFLQNYVQPAVA